MSLLSGLGSTLNLPNSGTQSTSNSSTSSTSNSISLPSTNGVNLTGLASGLNTNQLIAAVTAADQVEITDLQHNLSSINQQESVYGTLQSDLQGLQQAVSTLTQTNNGVFSQLAVSSSNANAATATASTGAAAGIYQFHVNTLAQAESLASQGYASANASVGTGTFQVQVGSGATTNITVNSTNNTLQGLAAAINNANGGVTASVVNTGNGSNPYQLLLTSTHTGAANTINVTSNLSGGANPDLSTVVQSAANASITIGSGKNALQIQSASNTVTGAFQGLNLNLLQANSDVTLTVANDTTASGQAVSNFVTAFNTVADYINSNSTYNAQTKQAGSLLGNSTAQNILNSITQAVNSVVPGVNSKASTLSAIGITLSSTGDLTVDNNKLNQALSGQLSGVSTSDIQNLFALDGTSTNPAVQFVDGTDKTTGNGTPIAVNVTQVASQASVTGGAGLTVNATSGQVSFDNTNNQLALSVNGQSGNLTLPTGSFTPQQVVDNLQGQINGNSVLRVQGVTVGLNASNQLTITSGIYGSASSVNIVGGNAVTSGVLGLTPGQSNTGTDVAGTFGSEPATGNGQVLSGNSGNATTDGLQVLVGLTGTQTPSNPVANLTVTRGLAATLNQAINQFIDPTSGLLTLATQSLQTNATKTQQTITQQQSSLAAKQQTLVQQFANMESSLATLKTTGDFLSAQLAAMTNSNSSGG